MNDAKTLETQRSIRGLAKLNRTVAVVFSAVALAVGCQKKAPEQGITPADPQVAANLAMLSHELRKALPRLNKSTNFDDFVAVSHVEVPPPPAGQKYAISSKWKIILVEAK